MVIMKNCNKNSVPLEGDDLDGLGVRVVCQEPNCETVQFCRLNQVTNFNDSDEIVTITASLQPVSGCERLDCGSNFTNKIRAGLETDLLKILLQTD